VIVVDDGSPKRGASDLQEKAVSKFSDRLNIRVIHQENKGVCTARNNGVKCLNKDTDYIIFLDADDYLAENYIETMIECAEFKPEADVIYCDAELVGDATGIMEAPPFHELRLRCKNFLHVSAMVRYDSFIEAGMFDENMNTLSLEDWELWMRVCYKHGLFIKNWETVLKYRQKERSRNKLDKDKYADTLEYIKEKHGEFFIRM
jgi:glycosyltransferase involved in cell wall biosynthesis